MQTVKTPGIPARLISHYPTGFAWPATDDRVGLYVMCPYSAHQPMTLGVHDDFGNLVAVPSRELMVTTQPVNGVWQ